MDASDISVARDNLNSMLQLWLSQGIDLGTVPLDAPGDELSEPLDARQAIIDNLAIYMAPDFEQRNPIVSQSLIKNARIGLVLIKGLYQNLTIPDKVVSSTLPRGAGNNRGIFTRIFYEKGATLDSSDS